MGNTWRMLRTCVTVLRKPMTVKTRPVHFQLEPTVGCNLLCKTCQVPGYDERRFMSLDRFADAFSQIKPLKIGLSGAGEPFLNKDMLGIIRYAKQGGASVLTATNFTLCRGKIEEIVDSGLDLIKISLDAATPETYHKIRGRDFFLRILEDLKTLQETKRRKGTVTPYVRLQFVLQHDNVGEIPDLIDVAKEMGADSVYYQPLETLLVADRKDELTEGVTRDLLAERLSEARDKAEADDIGTNAGILLGSLPSYYRKYEKGAPEDPPSRVCLLPWFSVYITVDGNVRPCCSFGDNETLVMGNIFDTPFEEIWNSEKYLKFRRAAVDRRLGYEVCRNCTPNRLRDFLSLTSVLPGFFKPRNRKGPSC